MSLLEFNYLFFHTSRQVRVVTKKYKMLKNSTGRFETLGMQEMNGTLCYQKYPRKYFDLKNGKIVRVNERFFLLSVSFVSESGDHAQSDRSGSGTDT